jgi:hypothetical protein
MCQPTISKLIERNREHLNTVSGEDLLLILTEFDGLRIEKIETSGAAAHPISIKSTVRETINYF